MLLTVAAVSLFFSIAKGQNAIGLKGGINFGNLSAFEGESRISGHGGVFLHHTINKNWCFQPELLFSGEGQRYIANGNDERVLALDYIQLPLMIQYYPAPQVYFEAGPQIGVLISAQDKGNAEAHLNVKDDFSKAQVALGVGVGFKATEQLILYGRYNFGLTDVTRFDDIVDRSRVGQIGVAVRLKH